MAFGKRNPWKRRSKARYMVIGVIVIVLAIALGLAYENSLSQIKGTSTHTTTKATTAKTTTVSAAPLSLTISPTFRSMDAFQNVTFTNTTKGGTSPFTYSYAVNRSGWSRDANSYTLELPGTYKITLTVTDRNGKKASAYSIVTVYDDPTIHVHASTTNATVRENVTFFNSATGGSNKYSYSYFVNQSNYTRNGNIFAFNSIGRYKVTVTVTDSYHVQDNASVIINVTA